MVGLFQLCVVFGGAILVLQVLLTLVGLGGSGSLEVGGGDVPDPHLPDGHAPGGHIGPGAPADTEGSGHASTSDALNLLSVRSLAAGVAFFGAGGLALQASVGVWLAAGLAVVPAFAAMYATAWLTRQMLRMQTSGTLRLSGAVGTEAKVYLTVPPASVDGREHGLVHVALQGRMVELRAVTREATALPSGSTVVILSVSDDETAEVVPSSTFEDMLHEDAS